MSDDVKNPFSKPFESSSKDLGIKFVENMMKRRIETMSRGDVMRALTKAATEGNPGMKTQPYVDFIRELLRGDLAFKTTSADRKEVFRIAAHHSIINVSVKNLPKGN